MGEVFFYHLTRRPLEAVLPVLLDRARKAQWRTELRGTDAGRMRWLDDLLWTARTDSFLPHGLAGGAHDAQQPVLLTVAGQAAANAPHCLICVDGAPLGAEEAGAAARTCVIFDGGDGAAVSHARGQWKELVGAGCAAQYWSEESGSWEMKAESG